MSSKNSMISNETQFDTINFIYIYIYFTLKTKSKNNRKNCQNQSERYEKRYSKSKINSDIVRIKYFQSA